MNHMKTYIVYKDESDHARSVIDFRRDFKRQTGREIEAIDPETRAGASFCRTYDVVEYPTIVAVDDNGVLQNMWRGTTFPTISELSYYA